ncbi:MAG: hypothetical protein WCL29_05575, partial [Pseudomonadota bacterium]
MSSAKIESEGTLMLSGWAQQQRGTRKHLTGFIFVVSIHGFVLWLIMSGAGQQFIKAVAPKSIVEVILPPEPPPPEPPPPPPKKPLDTPPPPDVYVPVSEVA